MQMHMHMLDYIHTVALNKHLQLRLAGPAFSEVVSSVSLPIHVSLFPQTSSLFAQLPQIVLQRQMSVKRRGVEVCKTRAMQKNPTVL